MEKCSTNTSSFIIINPEEDNSDNHIFSVSSTHRTFVHKINYSAIAEIDIKSHCDYHV